MLCPVCGTNLELKQINFTNAVFICMDLKCPYPVGTECIQVKRNYQDINRIYPKYMKNQGRTSQNEMSLISDSSTKITKKLYAECNIPQSFETSSSCSNEVFSNNQVNVNQSIDTINFSQTNFDLSDMDDLDNFISELLK